MHIYIWERKREIEVKRGIHIENKVPEYSSTAWNDWNGITGVAKFILEVVMFLDQEIERSE